MQIWLCHCANRCIPPISTVGSPNLPEVPASPEYSPEFHTPSIEVWSLGMVSLAPVTPDPILVPPPVTSPLPPSDVENIPPACCSNPPPPRAPLVPIEEVMSDAEDSDAIAKRAEGALDEEVALSFLNRNNQGQGACCRAVCFLSHCTHSYAHWMQLWELCHRTPLFPLFPPIYARSPVLSTTLNCIIMPHDYYDNTWHMLMVKIPCIGYNSWTWSINFKALHCQLTTIGDSGYWQHGMSTLKPKDEFYTKHVTPLVTEPMGCSMTIPLCLCKHLYDFLMSIISYAYPFYLLSPLCSHDNNGHFH